MGATSTYMERTIGNQGTPTLFGSSVFVFEKTDLCKILNNLVTQNWSGNKNSVFVLTE